MFSDERTVILEYNFELKNLLDLKYKFTITQKYMVKVTL